MDDWKRGAPAWLALAVAVLFYSNESKAGVWIDASIACYHFDRSVERNERNNLGVGLELDVAHNVRVIAGQYKNSGWETSRYFGVTWLPFSQGPVRFGLAAGMVNGYSDVNGGGYFPVAMPTVAIEYERIGINIVVAPRYKESPGMIGLQIKVLVWE